jgi:hypothetical protein
MALFLPELVETTDSLVKALQVIPLLAQELVESGDKLVVHGDGVKLRVVKRSREPRVVTGIVCPGLSQFLVVVAEALKNARFGRAQAREISDRVHVRQRPSTLILAISGL